jgi:hypothetical protein
MPPRRFSPDLRALAKIAISCCFGLTGKPASMRKSSTAQPSLLVAFVAATDLAGAARCGLGDGTRPQGAPEQQSEAV